MRAQHEPSQPYKTQGMGRGLCRKERRWGLDVSGQGVEVRSRYREAALCRGDVMRGSTTHEACGCHPAQRHPTMTGMTWD